MSDERKIKEKIKEIKARNIVTSDKIKGKVSEERTIEGKENNERREERRASDKDNIKTSYLE